MATPSQSDLSGYADHKRQCQELMAKAEPAEGFLFSEAAIKPWLAEWQNMPEFDQRDLAPKFQVLMSFACEADLDDFSDKIGVPSIKANYNATIKQSCWYPARDRNVNLNFRYRGSTQ